MLGRKQILAMVGAMVIASAFADTQTVDGVTWTYTISNGEAKIGDGTYGKAAIATATEGIIAVPSMLGDCPVTSIGETAFQGCRKVTEVSIPEGVSLIGGNAFYECSGLTSVAMPSSLRTIDDGAFLYCSSLEKVEIPDGVVRIGGYAFARCPMLTSVTIPDSVKSIDGSFVAWGKVTEILVARSNVFFSVRNGMLYDAGGTELICCPSGFKSADIPEGTKVVGPSAICGCDELESIVLPEGLVSLERGAIDACPKIQTLAIPASVEKIDPYQFVGCDALTSFTVSEDNLFYSERSGLLCDKAGTTVTHCPRGARSAVVPSGVTSIGGYAFSYCKVLGSVELPEGVVSIGSKAFFDGYELKKVVLPPGLSEIGSDAFARCWGLECVVFPNSLTRIGTSAFEQCHLKTAYVDVGDGERIRGLLVDSGFDVSEVTFQEGVPAKPDGTYTETVDGIEWTYVIKNGEASVGSGSSSLTAVPRSTRGELVIPVTLGGCPVTGVADYAFYGCSLNAVTIPDGVTSIGSWAFGYCGSLREVVILEGIVAVPFCAFQYCSELSSVALPSTVKSIDESAFSYCKHLRNISLADGNTAFMVKDGCLLSADGTRLIRGMLAEFVDIPEGVTTICTAFCGMDETFKGVRLPSTVKTLQIASFAECIGLTNVVIPASVTAIAVNAFSGDSALESIEVERGNARYMSEGGALYNAAGTELISAPHTQSEFVILPTVTKIWERAFSGSTNLTSIVIPSSVTSLGYLAFEDCRCLKEVYFEGNAPEGGESDSVPQRIYSSTPQDLVTYVKPGSTGWRGAGVAGLPQEWPVGDYDARPIQYVQPSVKPDGAYDEVVDGVTFNFTVIDGKASLGGGSNKATVVPTSTRGTVKVPATLGGCPVTALGRSAFDACSGVTEVILPDGLQDVGSMAFRGCASLQQALLPASVTSVGTGAFTGCTALEELTLPNGLASIGNYAFSYCKSVAAVTVPATVTSIGISAFEGCTGIESVRFNGNVPSGLTRSCLLDTATRVFYPRAYESAYAAIVPAEKFAGYSDAKGLMLMKAASAGQPVLVDDTWAAETLDSRFGNGKVAEFREKFGRDFAAALFKTTGKVGADGRALTVLDDFISGTDPTDGDSKLQAKIEIGADGKPKVTWTPDLNEGSTKDERTYRVMGAKNLGDGWTEVPSGNEADFNFFKVEVSMPNN